MMTIYIEAERSAAWRVDRKKLDDFVARLEEETRE
jgi:hypothetical protein